MMMIAGGALLLLLLSAWPAAAQTAEQRADFGTALWIYAATSGADWSVTAVCVQVGCTTDTHPFLRGAPEDLSPKIHVPIGLAIDAGIAYSIKRWVFPHKPRLAIGLLHLTSTVRLVVLTHRVTDLQTNTVRTAPP